MIDAGDTTIFTVPEGCTFWRQLKIRFEYLIAPAPKMLRTLVWGQSRTVHEAK